MRYKATKDTVVGGCNARGESITIKFDSKGSYSTTDEDEIRLLDAAAEDASNPVGFAPKEG